MAAAGTRGDDRAKPEWGKQTGGAEPRQGARSAGAKKAKPTAKAASPARAPSHAKKAPARGAKRGAKATGITKRPVASPARARGRTATTKGRGQRSGGSTWGRRLRQRYAVVYDTNGPRVRLGIAWFLVALVAIIVGPAGTAVVYGVAAAVAAAQLSRVWQKEGRASSETMASGGALLVALGGCFGAGGGGLGILAAVALAYVGSGDGASPGSRLGATGWTLQCALAPGLVALSMVLLTRLDEGSAVALLLLVSVYEIGDYLIGSSAKNPYEGPAAGIAAIVVITFIVSTLPVSSLEFGQAWLFGGAVAVLAPAGQLVGSALLPSAASPASALRRLDSLLLTPPLWAWGVGLVL
jgi:hypothetical protein